MLLSSRLVDHGHWPQHHSPDEPEGPYHCQLISRIINVLFFDGPASLGAKQVIPFSEITHNLMAYVCITIEHCLNEWSSVDFRKKKLEKAKVKRMYSSHMELIQKLELAQMPAFQSYRKSILKKAR